MGEGEGLGGGTSEGALICMKSEGPLMTGFIVDLRGAWLLRSVRLALLEAFVARFLPSATQEYTVDGRPWTLDLGKSSLGTKLMGGTG